MQAKQADEKTANSQSDSDVHVQHTRARTWFKLTSSQESIFKLPNSEGSVPSIRLFLRWSICSIGKLASDQGNVPDILLLKTSILCMGKETRRPESIGEYGYKLTFLMHNWTDLQMNEYACSPSAVYSWKDSGFVPRTDYHTAPDFRGVLGFQEMMAG